MGNDYAMDWQPFNTYRRLPFPFFASTAVNLLNGITVNGLGEVSMEPQTIMNPNLMTIGESLMLFLLADLIVKLTSSFLLACLMF